MLLWLHGSCVVWFLCAKQSKRLRIHEDNSGSIYVAGATTQRVESAAEVMMRGYWDGGGVGYCGGVMILVRCGILGRCWDGGGMGYWGGVGMGEVWDIGEVLGWGGVGYCGDVGMGEVWDIGEVLGWGRYGILGKCWDGGGMGYWGGVGMGYWGDVGMGEV